MRDWSVSMGRSYQVLSVTFLLEEQTFELTHLQGVNPFATITALVERSVDVIAKKDGLNVATSKNGRLNLFGRPARSFALAPDIVASRKGTHSASSSEGGVRFTEILDGHIHIGDSIDDFRIAENVAKGAASSARLYITVDVPGVERRMYSLSLILHWLNTSQSTNAQLLHR